MPDDLSYELIRKTLRLGSYIGYRMEIEGKENLAENADSLREGVIFAGNHESVIDAFLMGLAVPTTIPRVRFLGKQSALWRNRYWGKMMDYFGVIPVKDSRGKGKRKGSNKEAIRKGIEVLENKQALGIFPEGHIRYSRKALDGKVGVARFAFETTSPVVPVGIIGTDGLLKYGGNWPSLGKKVVLSVGEPLFFDNYDKGDIYDINALREATDLIMNKIRILSSGYGVYPRDAGSLQCMIGVDRLLVPEHIIKANGAGTRRKKANAASRFDEWLTDIDSTAGASKNKRSRVEPPPQGPGTADKFIDWLDNQL